jgi:signal peptidase I
MDQPENQTPNRNFFSGFAAGWLLVWDFLKIVLVALVIIIPIRYFVFQPFIVSGSSMEPNFFDNQYLIIDELSYHIGDPKRGDVVVIHSPKDGKQYYIKRIIGLPGEKVQIDNGKVTIYNANNPQGVTLDEKYLPNQGLTYEQDPIVVGGNKILTLTDDQYFLLGDNRLASSDSRDWGPLLRKEIVGKAFVRVLPLPEFKFFTKTPAYGF